MFCFEKFYVSIKLIVCNRYFVILHTLREEMKMGEKIKIFLNTISNSLNPDGYSQIVGLKSLGEATIKINSKRRKSHYKIDRVVNAKIEKITKSK